MEFIIKFIVFIIDLAIVYLPTIIAFRKGNCNKLMVLAINFVPRLMINGYYLVASIIFKRNFMYEVIYYGWLDLFAIIYFVLLLIGFIAWIVALIKAIRDM